MNMRAGNGQDTFYRWQHQSKRVERHWVLPDGCQDLLILRRGQAPAEVLLTDLDFQPRAVSTHPDVCFTGYRLRPGVRPSADALEAIAAHPEQVEALLVDACGSGPQTELEQVIAALAEPGASAQAVAAAAGVSLRTLQRRFHAQGLPAPDFWRQLGRARHAAAFLAGAAPLAEIAYACGYSDQAHMAREISRWFGGSPMQFRTDPTTFDQFAQPALGSWTGEHISTI